jgi:hypothetical protein
MVHDWIFVLFIGDDIECQPQHGKQIVKTMKTYMTNDELCEVFEGFELCN